VRARVWGGAPRLCHRPAAGSGLSWSWRTLGAMSSERGQAVIPAWVVPEHGRIVELHHLVHQLAEVVGSAEHRGQLAAVEWVTGCRPLAPVTHRDERLTRDAVRAEAIVALNVAAEAPTLLERDWPSFGLCTDVYFVPAVERDAEHAHGVWRTLAWIVGTRPDPPVELPERDAAGELVDGPRYAVRPDLSSPIWRASEARRRNHAREDAQEHWARVRAYLRTRRAV
jgi:hypothetical protein